jgi:hypothetical protein
VGLVTGVAYGLLALNTKGKLDTTCAVKSACPPVAQSAIDTMSTQATISNVGFGVGIAGLVVGGVLYWLSRGSDETKAASGMHPWLGPGSAGLVGTLP